MALNLASSFCAKIPLNFRAKPTSPFFSKSILSPFSRQFSSQIVTASVKDEFSGRVGFLGIGIMGSPMALNLINAGCDVTVWNRTKSKCDSLISLGAKYKPTPEEVASSCDVTIAMLADPDSAMEVACGKHGAASGMGPGKGYVDVSTVDGPTSKLISERIKATGALFLEVCTVILYLYHTTKIHFTGSCFWLQEASRGWAADIPNCRRVITHNLSDL
ncbi:hypothetical protein KSS87_019182 [Heliosperma pusillum]|nr:hypothetical protein KSS87_019182 [Heliosperma pusillum]